MKRLVAMSLLAVAATLMACEETPSGLIVGTGTLQQWGGECGDTWLLSADSGRRYELTSLPAEFQEQDLRVRFTLRPRADVASTCMVGAAADVVSMAKL